MSRRTLLAAAFFIVGACTEDAPVAATAPANDPGLGSLLGGLTNALLDVQVTPIDLGTLGGASSFAADVNNWRVVVGWSENSAGALRAFRWSASTGMQDLGTLPGDDFSRALAITDDGRILGLSGRNDGSPATPVTWSPSLAISALPIPLLPGAAFGEATHFNRNGLVVGWDVVGGFQHAWAWSSARGKRDITDAAPGTRFEGVSSQVNNFNVVAGSNTAATCGSFTQCWRAFLWTFDGGYRELGFPGSDPNIAVTALGLNDLSVVVGWTRAPTGSGLRPFRWNALRGFTALPTTSSGFATSVNTIGAAVGTTSNPVTGVAQASFWPASGGLAFLSDNDSLPSVALAINDFGAIAGWQSQDPIGFSSRAHLWITGPTLEILSNNLGGGVSAAVSGLAGAAACATNPQSLISIGTLLSCVAGQ